MWLKSVSPLPVPAELLSLLDYRPPATTEDILRQRELISFTVKNFPDRFKHVYRGGYITSKEVPSYVIKILQDNIDKLQVVCWDSTLFEQSLNELPAPEEERISALRRFWQTPGQLWVFSPNHIGGEESGYYGESDKDCIIREVWIPFKPHRYEYGLLNLRIVSPLVTSFPASVGEVLPQIDYGYDHIFDDIGYHSLGENSGRFPHDLHFLYQRVPMLRRSRNRVDTETSGRYPAQMYSYDTEVVFLREPMHGRQDGTEGRIVHWQHQWSVRGHERRAYDRETGRYRRVWVRPYTKGPSGKPLKPPTEQVFRVVW